MKLECLRARCPFLGKTPSLGVLKFTVIQVERPCPNKFLSASVQKFGHAKIVWLKSGKTTCLSKTLSSGTPEDVLSRRPCLSKMSSGVPKRTSP